MVGSERANRFKFNAYDLFANFLPGAILLIGLAIPFIDPEEIFPAFNLIEALIAIVIAFGLGIITQSLGSVASSRKVFGRWPWTDRERPFNEKMTRMLQADERSSEFSNIDWTAKELCVEVFDLNCDGSDDCEHLFKALLAHLEASQWSRGLRIQALHLSSRGLYIAALILLIYYMGFAIGLKIPSEHSIFVYTGSLNALYFLLLSASMLTLIMDSISTGPSL